MILWFSGTGNSRYVAERLATLLGEPLRELDRTPVFSFSPASGGHDSRRIIWVFPVYSWGVPPYIRKQIRQAEITGCKAESITHHLVLTCGDDCGLTPEMWRHDLAARGMKAGNAYSVIMPNNYVCMKGFDVDPKDVEQAKLDAAPARIADIARSISEFIPGETQCLTDVTRGRFPWIKSRLIYPWFVRNAMSPKPFRYTSGCISCGKCAAACPTRNITMLPDQNPRPRKRPVWGTNCAGCLACYHVCPRHAVMYGKSTLKKGQYMCPLI